MFDDSGIKLKEVRDFVHKARAGSAPVLNEISYKLYIKLSMCPQETHCPPSAGLVEGYCTTGMVSGRWYLNTKENAAKRYHKFSPNIPPKCRRENIFWSSCSLYDNLSDEQSLYKYICTEGWDTWLYRMSGTFTDDMELNHHHHHVALVARISLTLSRHSSLSFIAPGRSSGQHPVSTHSC